MGGSNESVLKASKPNKGSKTSGDTLAADGVQTQSIRQHMSGGECHFHDDAAKLKAAIPVADWYSVLRQLRWGQAVMFVDDANGSLLGFDPVFGDGTVELTVSLTKLNCGQRFGQVIGLTGGR